MGGFHIAQDGWSGVLQGCAHYIPICDPQAQVEPIVTEALMNPSPPFFTGQIGRASCRERVSSPV